MGFNSGFKGLKISNLIEDVTHWQTITKKVQESHAGGHKNKLGLVDIPEPFEW